MARKRLPMSQVKEILRLLRVQKQSVRATSRALGVSVGVVSKVSNRATAQGLTWAMASELSEAEVAARLYGRGAAAGAQRPEPDPVAMHKALMGLGVTLELLHLEYLAEHPAGLKYTAFCDRYRKWKKRCRVTMRQPHKVGENAFIDFSGKRPHYFDATRSWACGPRTHGALPALSLGLVGSEVALEPSVRSAPVHLEIFVMVVLGEDAEEMVSSVMRKTDIQSVRKAEEEPPEPSTEDHVEAAKALRRAGYRGPGGER